MKNRILLTLVLIVLALSTIAAAGNWEYGLPSGGYIEIYCKDGTNAEALVEHGRVLVRCE